MKYKRNIYAYLHNLCKLVIFFITIKNMDMMNYIILKYFYRKPEEILSFLMILDENPNFPPKFCIFKILINKKKKIKVKFFNF